MDILSFERGISLSPARLNSLLDGLPDKLLRKIERLSKEASLPVVELVEQSIALYEKRIEPRVKTTGVADRFDQLMSDPEVRHIYRQVTEAIGLRASASMTPAQRKKRGEKGGEGRAKKLSKARRKEIARQAGRASARVRAAKKAAASQPE